MTRYPLVTLVILDGWGCAPAGPGNAVELAATPVFDRLWREYPHTTLKASGEAVGLPEGQMGNSEVGHLTIGSGRVIDMDLQRVNRAIESGAFFENEALRGAFARARERGASVHLLGLVSKGGVHSHLDHFRALLELARREGLEDRVWIHAFTDGRDVSPTAAVHDIAELPLDEIADVTGRYWAMDRDKRWDRTDRALAAILDGVGATGTDPASDLQRSYDAGVTDEFVEPIVYAQVPRLGPDDAAIFVNFRPDRARQLTERLLARGFDVTTMTRYRDDFACPVAFPEQVVRATLAEVLSEHGARQLHMAETEKYAHVTYFFNGGDEHRWSGEERQLIPSPREVATYDQKPEMSAPEVTERFAGEIGSGYAFAVINFANPDMVGHSGVIPAAVRAVETVDGCLGRVADAVQAAGGVCLVTADHGNAEELIAADGGPQTAHTTNPVPLVVTDPDASLRDGGELADLAPTVLTYLGFDIPAEMTGRSLVNPS
ncbi:MAG TPA: 2,3-bisphosphoglycerate-independent phosphoglycerate mutase [Gaiellaceae bacterium]|nr:2,3-bisphosphoglycerate-independent phosphoglycerate mutase [Gaiellaceae bacterium]